MRSGTPSGRSWRLTASYADHYNLSQATLIWRMSSKFGSYRRFGPEDEGKRVLTATGEVVGDVDLVKAGRAYVKPEPGLFDGRGSVIHSRWEGTDHFPLDEHRVEEVTNDAVVLKAGDSEARIVPPNR